MAELQDIIAYLLREYPHKHELSNARVTKMVYLADWKSVLERGRQVSSITWYFDNYGPFVWDVAKTTQEHPSLFEMQQTANVFGGEKLLMRLKDENYGCPSLSDEDRQTLDFVIKQTAPKHWDGFIKLVYSTYPIMSSDRYSMLDLATKAKEYQEQESE
jgi:hypothetical protein